jgi:hypothetical protein
MSPHNIWSLAGSLLVIALVTAIGIHAAGLANFTTALGGVANTALKTSING